MFPICTVSVLHHSISAIKFRSSEGLDLEEMNTYPPIICGIARCCLSLIVTVSMLRK